MWAFRDEEWKYQWASFWFVCPAATLEMNEPCFKLPCNKNFTSEGGVPRTKKYRWQLNGARLQGKKEHYISPSVTNSISNVACKDGSMLMLCLPDILLCWFDHVDQYDHKRQAINSKLCSFHWFEGSSFWLISWNGFLGQKSQWLMVMALMQTDKWDISDAKLIIYVYSVIVTFLDESPCRVIQMHIVIIR